MQEKRGDVSLRGPQNDRLPSGWRLLAARKRVWGFFLPAAPSYTDCMQAANKVVPLIFKLKQICS